jgi:hypothetical protein
VYNLKDETSNSYILDTNNDEDILQDVSKTGVREPNWALVPEYAFFHLKKDTAVLVHIST